MADNVFSGSACDIRPVPRVSPDDLLSDASIDDPPPDMPGCDSPDLTPFDEDPPCPEITSTTPTAVTYGGDVTVPDLRLKFCKGTCCDYDLQAELDLPCPVIGPSTPTTKPVAFGTDGTGSVAFGFSPAEGGDADDPCAKDLDIDVKAPCPTVTPTTPTAATVTTNTSGPSAIQYGFVKNLADCSYSLVISAHLPTGGSGGGGSDPPYYTYLFPARITAVVNDSSTSVGDSEPDRYGFVEVALDGDGSVIDTPGGITSDGNTGYAFAFPDAEYDIDDIVLMRPSVTTPGLYDILTILGEDSSQFLAKITTSSYEDGLTLYSIKEIELTPGTFTYREKVSGRHGTAYRPPTAEVEPPPIPLLQTVLAWKSNTVRGAYEITPWGGTFRMTREFVSNATGGAYPNPADCASFGVSILVDYTQLNIQGDGICSGYTPADEGES